MISLSILHIQIPAKPVLTFSCELCWQVQESMEDQTAAAAGLDSRVKASLVLGTESFAISSESGILSEQLAAMKEKSMEILKGYITKHNAPADVPDEPIEGLSDDEGDAPAKNPPKKPKKQK